MITSFFKPKRGRVSGDAETSANDNENNGSNNSNKRRSAAGGVGTKNIDEEETNGKKPKTDTRLLTPEALLLISYLKEEGDENVGDDDGQPARSAWRTALDRHFSTPSFARLASFVESQRR
jgi:hypothetical protein